MYTNGRFEAISDGRFYDADVDVPYSANKTYHVRMLTDLDAGTYDVWVTPPDGTETQIGRIPITVFPSEVPLTDDLGKVCMIHVGSGEFRVENHTVTPLHFRQTQTMLMMMVTVCPKTRATVTTRSLPVIP